LIGAIIGRCVPSMGVSDYYIDEMLIDPEYQNQGLGSQFFEYLKNELNKINIAGIN